MPTLLPTLPIPLCLTRWRNRLRARCAMGFLLHRPDDRLIDDIGLTRQELRELLDLWSDRP